MENETFWRLLHWYIEVIGAEVLLLRQLMYDLQNIKWTIRLLLKLIVLDKIYFCCGALFMIGGTWKMFSLFCKILINCSAAFTFKALGILTYPVPTPDKVKKLT